MLKFISCCDIITLQIMSSEMIFIYYERLNNMTNTERTFSILNYKGDIDRLPAVHFGYWDELLQEWADQGHISSAIANSLADSNDADKELDKILGWDFNWCNLKGGNVKLAPPFEHKVLEELSDGFIRVQNSEGLIERTRKGAGSIPSEDDYQLKDKESFEALYKPKMQFSQERIINAGVNRMQKDESHDAPIAIEMGSILGTVRNFLSVIGLSYMMYDDYELLQEIVDTYAEMQYKTVEATLKTGMKFDFAHYWEDICFKNGPLLSPDIFDDLCAKHYKKRNDLVKSYGIEIISLDCDGVTDALQKTWIDNGVNTLFPIEVGTWGDQFEKARERFGKEQRGVGGLDKTCFLKNRNAVDDELTRIERLYKLGGFIPCPDHRLMPGSDFKLVKYYIEQVKTIK